MKSSFSPCIIFSFRLGSLSTFCKFFVLVVVLFVYIVVLLFCLMSQVVFSRKQTLRFGEVFEEHLWDSFLWWRGGRQG